MYDFKKLYLMRAFRISFAVSLGMLIWFLFNQERGYYIPMTIMLIYAPYQHDLVENRLKQRLAGTIFGVLLAILLIQLINISILVLTIIPILALVFIYYIKINYLLASTVITLVIFLIFGLMDTKNESLYSFAIARLIDTLIAAIICFTLEKWLVPKYAIKNLIYNRIEQLLQIYQNRLNDLLSLAQSTQTNADIYDNAVIFNADAESLKDKIITNQKKLDANTQMKLNSCIQSFALLNRSFTSISYLIHQYRYKVEQFIDKNPQLTKNLSNLSTSQNAQSTCVQETNQTPYLKNSCEYLLLNNFHDIIHQHKEILSTLSLLNLNDQVITPTTHTL